MLHACDPGNGSTSIFENTDEADEVIYDDPKRKRGLSNQSQSATMEEDVGFSNYDGQQSKNKLSVGAAVQARQTQ